jgi:(S)-3,5-dihydroxyphenylglycine transaminase
VVSNFANPSGVSLSDEVRRGLIKVAADEDLLILEDDPYGLFGADDRHRLALKSLDTDQRVIYLGSFAKSVFPGARVGFLVADQAVVSADGHRTLLADELSTVKSMVTVNTSPGTRRAAASSQSCACPSGPTRSCLSSRPEIMACCGRR